MGKTMFNKIGGQAVVEGVMMRAPGSVATAVRRPDGTIAVRRREYRSVTQRYRVFRLPVVRGAVALIESLGLGVGALMYSAEESAGETASEKTGRFSIALWGTVVLALLLGIGFFFYLPLLITEAIGVRGSIGFNVVDGIIRVAFLLLYIRAISMWKEMRRVLAYHGAEHKTIFTLESGRDLTVENAREFPTLHPRCGTSFLLIVMIVSVLVFVFLGRPDTIGERLIRFAFIPLIGGLSYEFLKLSARWADRSWMAPLIRPGLFMQTMTTREPDDSQLEVAIAALHAALGDRVNEREELLSDVG